MSTEYANSQIDVSNSSGRLSSSALDAVVSLLRACSRPITAHRIAQRHLNELFLLRLAVEAYLSNRAYDFNGIEPLKMVNALALFYYRTNRLALARNILKSAMTCDSFNIAWGSQTRLNLARLERMSGEQFFQSVEDLAIYLQKNADALKNSQPTIEAADQLSFSLYEVQIISLFRLVLTSAHVKEANPDTIKVLARLAFGFPEFMISDAGIIFNYLYSQEKELSIEVTWQTFKKASSARPRYLEQNQIASIFADTVSAILSVA